MSKKMKKILTILCLVLIFSIVMTSLGIAHARGVRGIGLLGISFFFTAAVVIVLAQLIPASVLLVLMIRSALSSIGSNEMPARA